MESAEHSMKRILEHNLTNHKPSDEGIQKIETLRAKAKEYGNLLIDTCPQEPELEYALHYLELASMFAVAAVARHAEA